MLSVILAIFFAATTAFCAFKWATRWAAAAGLIKYLHRMGYEFPAPEVMRACVTEAIKDRIRGKKSSSDA